MNHTPRDITVTLPYRNLKLLFLFYIGLPLGSESWKRNFYPQNKIFENTVLLTFNLNRFNSYKVSVFILYIWSIHLSRKNKRNIGKHR